MSDLESKLAELAKEFELNSGGRIRNPGKFEGESLAAPYYYGLYLDGSGDIFEITEEERQAFGFSEDDHYLYLEETNDGFIYVCLFMTESEAEDYQRDVEYRDDTWL